MVRDVSIPPTRSTLRIVGGKRRDTLLEKMVEDLPEPTEPVPSHEGHLTEEDLAEDLRERTAVYEGQEELHLRVAGIDHDLSFVPNGLQTLFNAHAEKIEKALREITIREVARAEQATELLHLYQQKTARLAAAEEQLALSEQGRLAAESRVEALEDDLRLYRQALKAESERAVPSPEPQRERTHEGDESRAPEHTHSRLTKRRPDPDKLTDGKEPQYDLWEQQIRQKLEVNKDHFVDERDKVLYIQGRTAGAAAKHLLPRTKHDSKAPLRTVEDVFRFLRSVCKDPMEKQRARGDYRKLFMRNGDDFHTFHTTFLELALLSELPEADYKDDFAEKMSYELQTPLAQKITDPDVTFDDLVAAATSQAFILERTTRRDKKKPESKTKEHAKAGTKGSAAASTTEPETATTLPTRSKLTDKERDQLMLTGGCFYCREHGHISAECPKKPKTDAKLAKPATPTSAPPSYASDTGSDSEN
jgi:hypothetical protein